MFIVLIMTLGLVIGAAWLYILLLRGLARAVVTEEPWIKTVSRIAFPLYVGTWGTHWVMGSTRLAREMGNWIAVINCVSVGLIALTLTSVGMRFVSRRADFGETMAVGFFACIGTAIGCALLLCAF